MGAIERQQRNGKNDMYATIQNKSGEVKIINAFGEAIKTKKNQVKSYGILWETVDGKWVKKIHAIKNNIKLTGKKEERHIKTNLMYVPV